MRAILLASTAVAVAMPAAFMSEVCETVMVKIKGTSGVVRVNRSDFETDQAGDKTMTLDDGKTEEQRTNASAAVNSVGGVSEPADPAVPVPVAPSAPKFADPVAPSTANADTIGAKKIGKKYFAVYVNSGEKVTGLKDIDEAGYDSDALAWAAIMNVKREPALQDPLNPPHVSTPTNTGENSPS